MSDKRTATKERKTGETDVRVKIVLDGKGESTIDTGVGFFDHMLTGLARHGRFDMEISCRGDLEIDEHHTVEDVGITLGQAIAGALGDKAGINRFADATVPMDEALARVAVDVSGRGYLFYRADINREGIGDLSSELVEEFWRSVASNAGITMHMDLLCGSNAHHQVESMFKAAARALNEALSINPDIEGVPSTKGQL